MKISMTLADLEFNPFEFYREFKNIWPDREGAPEADVVSWLKDPGTERKFLIVVENRAVGITGLWEMGDDKVALAWHGITPSDRKKGYSKAAMLRLIKMCPELYPKAKMLVESIPKDREDELRSYFEKLGFVATGKVVNHPEMYDGVTWMEYVYEFAPCS